MKKTILIIDDERTLRYVLTRQLKKAGYQVIEAENGAAGISEIKSGTIDLAILDLRLPDGNGLEFLEKIKDLHPGLPVIMMTAYSSVNTAVKALKNGAFDYVTKPCNLGELQLVIHKAFEVSQLKNEVQHLRKKVRGGAKSRQIIGESQAMCRILDEVKTVASMDDLSVLLLGESGTGKNLLAEVIHLESGRKERPFLTVTCTALPGTLIESELFGHEKGAFTDAQTTKQGLCEIADGGTLLLDEIGDLPLPLQAKLLGFIETKNFRRIGGTRDIQVDLRIIAATNKDLFTAVQKREFREDLYYRLNVSQIQIPPLRNRAEDIPQLVEFFIRELNVKLNKNIQFVAAPVIKAMQTYPWHGNIRELRNTLERSMIFAKGDELNWENFPETLFVGHYGEAVGAYMLPAEGINFEELERSLVCQALQRTNGNQAHAARLLHFTRDQMRYRVKLYGLR